MSRTKRPIRKRAVKPPLTVALILKWADEFRARHGRWPHLYDGPVEGVADQTWNGIDRALHDGTRGLTGGTSLAKLLLKHRGRRHWHLPAAVTVPQLLAWADAHRRKTGDWPHGRLADPIPDAPEGTTWFALDLALKFGRRGLPGGRTLAEILELHRGTRTRPNPTALTEEDILAWADAHRGRTGDWPRRECGVIPDAPDDTWCAIDAALAKGARGLPGGDSLAKLLARHRGARDRSALPALTVARILAWAEAHKSRAGKLPTRLSGAIPEAPGETWQIVNAALVVGVRGLPGGDSLSRLFERELGYRNMATIPSLTLERVKAWVLAHHAATGEWPRSVSGAIAGVPGETWCAMDNALRKGRRGLPSGSSVAKIVRECQKAEGE